MEKSRESAPQPFWWRAEKQEKNECAVAHKPGDKCPACGQGELAYDGLFLLACTACGAVAEGGAFT
jgi:ribosomal protein L37AE/L43A